MGGQAMFPVNRQPIAVYVEYTAHGKRVSKLFPNAAKAKSFYVAKDKAGASPKVIRAGERLPEMPK